MAYPSVRLLAWFDKNVSTGLLGIFKPSRVTVSLVRPLLMTWTAVVPSVLANAVTFRELVVSLVMVVPILVAPLRTNLEPKWAWAQRRLVTFTSAVLLMKRRDSLS